MPAAGILNAPGYLTSYVLKYNQDFSEVQVYRNMWEGMGTNVKKFTVIFWIFSVIKKYPE